MSEHLPRDEFADITSALFRPLPPPQSATLRVADLYCGDGELGRATKDAGLEVVYTRDPDSVTEHLDFEEIPPFDFLTATMPSTPDGREQAFGFVLRFLRVRRPETFLLMSEHLNGDGAGFIRVVRSKTRRLGYRVNPAKNGHDFVIGLLGINPFAFLPPDDILGDEQPPARPVLGAAQPRRERPALPPATQSAIERIMENLN